MKDTFNSIFMCDESGSPRAWNDDSVDISELFEKARDAGLGILRMFATCQLRGPKEKIPPHDCLTQRIIQPGTYQMYEQKFTNDIEQQYINAVRTREANRIRMHIPWPMVALFVIFGYDKIFFAIKYPFWALFILIILGVIYYLYSNKYLDKPIQQTAKFTAQVVANVVKIVVPGAAKQRPAKKKGVRRSGSQFDITLPERVSSGPLTVNHRKKSPAQRSTRRAMPRGQTLGRGFEFDTSLLESTDMDPPEPKPRAPSKRVSKKATSKRVMIDPSAAPRPN